MENLAALNIQYLIENRGISSIFKYDENLTNGIVMSVRSTKNLKTHEELEKFGIDPEAELISVLIEETVLSLSKELMKSISDAEETKNINHKFLIVSNRVATYFQNNENFKPASIKHQTGIIYKSGNFNNTEIIVDSWISYSQTHCLAFDNEYPISYKIEEDHSEDYYKIKVTFKVLDNLKCYVWNCPENLLEDFNANISW